MYISFFYFIGISCDYGADFNDLKAFLSSWYSSMFTNIQHPNKDSGVFSSTTAVVKTPIPMRTFLLGHCINKH
mgnify:CR=1 FL=1